MIILAFWKNSLFKPKKLQSFKIAIIKKGDFKSFDLKINFRKTFHLSTYNLQLTTSIYLECFKRLFDPKKFK